MREWVEAAGGMVHPALRLSLATPHGCRLCVFFNLRKPQLLRLFCCAALPDAVVLHVLFCKPPLTQ